MPKVFGIGLSRTGTSSLTEALRLMGYSSIHWPRSWNDIDSHEAATDITVSCRYQELDVRYPGSKFILTVRELQSWIRSCLFHYRHEIKYSDLPEPDRSFAWGAERRVYGPFGGVDLDADGFALAYKRHLRQVQRYFSQRSSDLLIFDILSGEGWEKIGSFLGRATPRFPFPHLNQR